MFHPVAVAELRDRPGGAEDAVRQVVVALERAQQDEAVEDFVALFRDDAIWTTATGRRSVGKAEIAEFTRQALPGAMRSSTAVYETVQVLFIRPDVAVVKVRQRPVAHSGEVLEDRPEGSPLYVMAEEDGRWLLVAGQNTFVQ